MYKIMIVDDDKHIRERLKKGINWPSLGLVICGEAADGDEALNIYEQSLPPIIIMDINMPNRDGLEVAREILTHDPEAIIICITGFNDFEYAQKAVKLGIYDIFRKPLDLCEVQQVLQKAVNNIEEMKKSRRDIKKLQKLADESLPMLQKAFLQGLLDGVLVMSEQDIIERSAYLQIDIKNSFYAIAILSPSIPVAKKDSDLNLVAISKTSEELINASGFKSTSLFDCLNNIILILSWSSQESSYNLDELFSNIRNKLLFYFDLNTYIGIGGSIQSPQKLYLSMKDAREALDYRHLFAHNNVVNIKNVKRIFNKPSTNYNLNMSHVIACFKDGNRDNLSSSLNDLAATVFSSSGGSTHTLQRIFIELTVLILHMASDIGVNADQILEFNDPYKRIMQMTNLGDILSWFNKLCDKLLTAIENKKGKRTNRVIYMAKQYIDKHYADSNISLNSTSEHVELSTVYFCQLFHNETGIKFSEYVNTVRIDHAKQLLKNSTLKIYEIAYNVGYNNPKYFNYIFKKHTGITPNEYRQGLN